MDDKATEAVLCYLREHYEMVEVGESTDGTGRFYDVRDRPSLMSMYVSRHILMPKPEPKPGVREPAAELLAALAELDVFMTGDQIHAVRKAMSHLHAALKEDC